MKIITFPYPQRRRIDLIEKLRQMRQHSDPGTDYVFAHYYSEDWSLQELEEIVAQTASHHNNISNSNEYAQHFA